MVKTIRILGKDWAVEERQLMDASGACDYSKCAIYIEPEQHKQQKKDAILHELLHAISDTTGIELSENQVHATAASLYCVMKDNEELTKWLFL